MKINWILCSSHQQHLYVNMFTGKKEFCWGLVRCRKIYYQRQIHSISFVVGTQVKFPTEKLQTLLLTKITWDELGHGGEEGGMVFTPGKQVFLRHPSTQMSSLLSSENRFSKNFIFVSPFQNVCSLSSLRHCSPKPSSKWQLLFPTWLNCLWSFLFNRTQSDQRVQSKK